jgi:hypothetical protein
VVAYILSLSSISGIWFINVAEEHEIFDMRLEVLTGMPMKSNLSWVVILCILQGRQCKSISLRMEPVVTPLVHMFSPPTQSFC